MPALQKGVAIEEEIADSVAMSEERLTDLESTLAFQERTIQDLSDVICGQQKEIDDLKAKCKALSERLDRDEKSGGNEQPLPDVEIPPHY